MNENQTVILPQGFTEKTLNTSERDLLEIQRAEESKTRSAERLRQQRGTNIDGHDGKQDA